jgi:hypothetical protein
MSERSKSFAFLAVAVVLIVVQIAIWIVPDRMAIAVLEVFGGL